MGTFRRLVDGLAVNVKTIRLGHGAHDPHDGEGCVMEIVSQLYGEPWSDTPKCADPVVANLAIAINDHCSDEQRQRLWPFTLRIGMTNQGKRESRRRKYILADHAVRKLAPLLYEDDLSVEDTEWLRSLPAIRDKRSYDKVVRLLTQREHSDPDGYWDEINNCIDNITSRREVGSEIVEYALSFTAFTSAVLDVLLDALDAVCPPAPSVRDAELLNWLGLEPLAGDQEMWDPALVETPRKR